MDFKSTGNTSTRTVNNKEISFDCGEVKISKVGFWTDNPRVLADVLDQTPLEGEITDEGIFTIMIGMSDIRKLKKEIKENGLFEPIQIGENPDKKSDFPFIVYEGNRRLACLKSLIRDPNKKVVKKFSWVTADKFDPKTSLSLVNQYVSQVHRKGKKDWPPYGEALAIHREVEFYLEKKNMNQGEAFEKVAKNQGLTPNPVKNKFKIIKFMKKHKISKRDEYSRWEVYVTNPTINAKRNEKMDKIVVEKSNKKELGTALEFREQFKAVCKTEKKGVLNDLLKGKTSLLQAYENSVESADVTIAYHRINSFLKWVQQPGIAKKVRQLANEEPEARMAIVKIMNASQSWLRDLKL